MEALIWLEILAGFLLLGIPTIIMVVTGIGIVLHAVTKFLMANPMQ